MLNLFDACVLLHKKKSLKLETLALKFRQYLVLKNWFMVNCISQCNKIYLLNI
jgi:hypothetical protein